MYSAIIFVFSQIIEALARESNAAAAWSCREEPYR
jgi:hypothetical protein